MLDTERRTLTRFPIELSVRMYREGTTHGTARTHDISARGLGLIEVCSEYEIGDEVELSITIPDKNEEIRCKGSVVWKERSVTSGSRLGIGLVDPRELKPVPLVLRAIHSRMLSHRFSDYYESSS
jgi:hypothetical protein